MIKSYLAGLVGAATLFAGPALAATYTTVDLSAIEGTDWRTMHLYGVRVDFGPGLGTGTVRYNGIAGGGLRTSNVPVAEYGTHWDTPYVPNDFNYTADLGNGDTLVSTAAGTGQVEVRTSDAPGATGIGGGELIFTLDSGNFLAGSMFLVGGIAQDTQWDPKGYFVAGQDFNGPLSLSLPALGSAPSTSLIEVGDFSRPGGYTEGVMYGSGAAVGRTGTAAFTLKENTNSFSIAMLSDPQRSQKAGAKMYFSFATVSAVPEPATWGMMIMGFGLTGAALRSRRARASFAA